MTASFFSRWSQRKQAVAKGLPVNTTDTPPGLDRQQIDHASPTEQTRPPGALPATATAKASDANAPTAGADQPLPTLEDLPGLTPASDFQPFMRPGVAAEVRNAAVKKLFTDPHFNVMDGLDIYIGDYNTPDPLPAGMLQKMVGAKLLDVWTDTAKSPGNAPAGPAPSPTSHQLAHASPGLPHAPSVVAQLPPSPLPPALQATPALQASEPTAHDHPDLQLQPNHAPASPSSGQSTG